MSTTTESKFLSFGNCSVITFGDFYQPQPVAAHYVQGFDQTNFSGISNLWIKNIVPAGDL